MVRREKPDQGQGEEKEEVDEADRRRGGIAWTKQLEGEGKQDVDCFNK